MSWHFTVDVTSDNNGIKEALEYAMPPTSETEAPGVIEQVEHAIECAGDLIMSERFGHGPYKIVLSGHAKQGDTDVHGNTVSISIHSFT